MDDIKRQTLRIRRDRHLAIREILPHLEQEIGAHFFRPCPGEAPDVLAKRLRSLLASTKQTSLYRWRVKVCTPDTGTSGGAWAFKAGRHDESFYIQTLLRGGLSKRKKAYFLSRWRKLERPVAAATQALTIPHVTNQPKAEGPSRYGAGRKEIAWR